MVLQDYTPQHMLATLRTRLLVMYAQVDIALEEAARSYEKGEAVRAIAVCDGDTAIDALENEIDELCLRLMARIKPVAGDLRFVVAALRMVVDLERIGDHCSNIALSVIQDQNDMIEPHEYMEKLNKKDNKTFAMQYAKYKEKYKLS